MSCDWNIYCRTCNATHDFLDANHKEDLMWHLIRHASSIAALAPLMEGDLFNGNLELRTFYGRIDSRWFRDHLGHDLVPISEYGDFGTPK